MAWIDSHCHLDDPRFSQDLPQVLERAQANNIGQFVIGAVGFHHWPDQRQLKEQYPGIFNAFGVHPWFCDLHSEQHLHQLEDLLPEAVAIGECGLDLMPHRPALESQLWWFQSQLKLAQIHDLPLIIHSVKATDMVIAQIRIYKGIRGVIHGFSGSLQQAQKLIRLGFLIGIGSRLLRENAAKAKLLITSLPLDAMLLETDAPDGLQKGVRNEPANLIQVARSVAEFRNSDQETILAACSSQAQELFQL